MYSPCGVKALHDFAEVLVYNADGAEAEYRTG